MNLDHKFQEYFETLDRSGNDDRCFFCRRTPSEVKAFFGFHEDGTPIDADQYGLEDVVLDTNLDIMSYRAERPVCSICQINFDAIFLSTNGKSLLRRMLRKMEHDRDDLWSE